MSSTATSTTQGAHAEQSPAGAFTSVLNAAVGSAAAKLERRAVIWTDKLNGITRGDNSSGGLAALADEGLDALAEGGGAKEKAGAEGIKVGTRSGQPSRGHGRRVPPL